MTEEEIVELRKRAESGEPEAMTAMGKLLLADVPHRGTGARYIGQAAAKNDAEALAQLAVLVAGGIGQASNWDLALDHMQRAAELGWPDAQEQMRILAHGKGADFAALRRNIDVAAWMKPPETVLQRERPRILTARALMSNIECERIIARAKPHLRRAGVYDHDTGGERVVDDRSNSKAELSLAEVDLLYVLLHARMANMLGLPLQCFEMTNILHYNPGERFKPHFDFLYTDEPGTAANVAQLGQRIVTLLVYLNDGYEGGETHFPRVNYAFKGGAGDALMFANVSEAGEPDLLSLHEGRPPASGEKWILSQWVRNKPAPRT